MHLFGFQYRKQNYRRNPYTIAVDSFNISLSEDHSLFSKKIEDLGHVVNELDLDIHRNYSFKPASDA